MKKYEKEAINEVRAICKNHNIEMLDMFKMFGIIDSNTNQVNNKIAKVRALVKILMTKYNYWNYGLEKELEAKGFKSVI